MKNKAAVELGRMGRGIKKTMTEAALNQRRMAAQARSMKAQEAKALSVPSSGNGQK